MEGSVSAELNPMNMMNSVPSNLSPALSKSLEDANKELEAVRARQREAIARALMPNQGKPMAKPEAKQAKYLPAPPVAKPQLKTCKDERCELPGRLFKPAKVTHDLCPGCSRRRKTEAEAARAEEQRIRNQIEETRREARKADKLIADLEAGHAFVCTTEGCGTIERPGVGYDPELFAFHCFKCREDYRKRKASGQVHAQPHRVANQRPEKLVVEDTATRARKQVKFEAQEFYVKGGEAALPKGVSLHQKLDRQITLKFVNGSETFYHTFVLPIDQAAKRAQDADAKKRRHENRLRVDDAPRGKGGNKGQKNENKKGKGRK